MNTQKCEYTAEDLGKVGKVVRGVTLVRPVSGEQSLQKLGTTVAHAVDNAGLIWDTFSAGADSWDEYTEDLSQDLAAVKDATVEAAKEYWESKLQNIKDMWRDTTEVSVQALVQTVAPYTQGVKFFNNVNERLQNLTYLLMGVPIPDEDDEEREKGWGDIFSYLGDEALTSVLTNSEVTDSVAELSFIQGAAESLKAYSQFVTDVTDFLEEIEPLLPYAELTWAWASAPTTGGASIALASGKTVTASQKAAYDLLAYALHDIKEMVFQWKVKLPTLLVKSVKIMTVQEASYKFTTGNAFLDELLSEDYYKTVTKSLVWDDTITSVSKKISNTDIHEKVISGKWLKNEIAQEAVGRILTTAYNNAKVSEKTYRDLEEWINEGVSALREWVNARNALDLNEDDIITISGYLITD